MVRLLTKVLPLVLVRLLTEVRLLLLTEGNGIGKIINGGNHLLSTPTNQKEGIIRVVSKVESSNHGAR